MAISWNEQNAAHLLGRAGFAATPEDVAASLKLGRAETVRRLVEGEAITGTNAAIPPMGQILAGGTPLSAASIGDAELYWLYRMIHSSSPFIERMTLFWHGHFATSYAKVRSVELMMKQNELFRSMALGNLHDLVQAVSQDPAMMIWLDVNSNRKGSANENYAREVMELFTLGIGHYTESDVKAAARALTGWHVDRQTGKVAFIPRLHDNGIKTILGETGQWDEAGFLRILFKQPSLYPFVAGKILRTFAADPPPDDWVKAVASDMAKQTDLRKVMANLFNSDDFYHPAYRTTLVRSPAEYVAGKALALQIPFSRNLNGLMRRMGQVLYEPPNVAGWPGSTTWITTSGLLTRYQWAEQTSAKAAAGIFEFQGKPLAGTPRSPEQWVEEAGKICALWQWSDASKSALTRYLTDNWGHRASNGLIDLSEAELRSLVLLVLMSPESQLC